MTHPKTRAAWVQTMTMHPILWDYLQTYVTTHNKYIRSDMKKRMKSFGVIGLSVDEGRELLDERARRKADRIQSGNILYEGNKS